jgi:hypothetical protein
MMGSIRSSFDAMHKLLGLAVMIAGLMLSLIIAGSTCGSMSFGQCFQRHVWGGTEDTVVYWGGGTNDEITYWGGGSKRVRSR